MAQLMKETGIAIVVFIAIQFAFGIGGDTAQDRVLGAVGFGVAYFLIGLVIRFFKSRNS